MMLPFRSFYKHLLGMPVDFGDIEATEPDYYKVLRTVLDTPLDDLMMDLTFSAETQKFGRTEVYPYHSFVIYLADSPPPHPPCARRWKSSSPTAATWR
jgi:hypothetical protein